MHSTPKQEKHQANSRMRRRSDPEKKSREEKDNKDKGKDTDSESIISASSMSHSTAPPASQSSKFPLRFLLSGMIDTKDRKSKGCPLLRVYLWHTIPLCLLTLINLLLIMVALLELAVYKIMMGVQTVIIEMMRSDFDIELYVERENVADTDSGTMVEN